MTNLEKQVGGATTLSELVSSLKPGALVWVFSSSVDNLGFKEVNQACERGGLDPFYIFWPRTRVNGDEPPDTFPLGPSGMKRIARTTNSVVINFAPLEPRIDENLSLNDVRSQWRGTLHECDAEIIIIREKGSAHIVRNRLGSWGPLAMES